MDFLGFISQYKEIILIIISIVCSCLCFIFSMLGSKFKKHRKVLSVFAMIPGFIKEAEIMYSTGVDKYQYVLKLVFEQLELLGITKDEAVKKYIALIDYLIEDILSTPQKKECRK